MEPKFTGPSFTIGIEEELMILDSESLALANAIEAVLEEYGEDDNVKPELLESVLEIATAPHPDTRGGGPRAAPAAARRRRGGRPPRPAASARRARTRSRCGRTSASPRAPATAS